MKQTTVAALSDQQTDSDFAVMHKIARSIQSDELSALLADITVDSTGLDKVASERFADPVSRRFPLDNRDNVVLSKLYFDHQKHLMTDKTAADIGGRIETYLDLYSIPESLFCYTTKTASSSKVPKAEYLLPSLKMCKVACSDDLAKASDLFDREHLKLQVSERIEFSQNFVKQASRLGTKVTNANVAKYAAELDTDMANTRNLLEARAAAAHRAGQSGDEYLKLASTLSKIEVAPGKKELKKLAELIHDLDVDHGLDTPKHEKRLGCAHSVVFNKEAEEAKSGPADPIKEMTKAEVVGRYGEGVLDEVETEDGEIDYDRLREIVAFLGKSDD